MWGTVLWGLAGMIVLYFVGKVVYGVWRQFRIMKLLNIDALEFSKCFWDKTLEDYLKAKYREKEELFRYCILRVLREKLTGATEEREQQFLQTCIGFLEDESADWWVCESVKMFSAGDSITSFGRWRRIRGNVVVKTVLQVVVSSPYQNGKKEERYEVYDLPDHVLKEMRELQYCDEVVS